MDEEISQLRRKVRQYGDAMSIARLAAALNRARQTAICELDGHYVIHNIEVFGSQRTACWLNDTDPKQPPLSATQQQELMKDLPRINQNARHELPPIPIFFASIATALQLRNDPEMGPTAQKFITHLWKHTQATHVFNTSTQFSLGKTDTITHGSMLGLRQTAPAMRIPQECIWEGNNTATPDCDTLCYAITGMLPTQLRQITAQFDNTSRADFQIILPPAEPPLTTGSMIISLTHAFGDATLNILFQSVPEKQIKGGTTIPVTYL